MKNNAARILFLCLLVGLAAFLRFLGTPRAGEILCSQIEERAKGAVQGLSLSIDECRISPWRSELSFKGIRLSMEGEIQAKLSVGEVGIQLMRPEVLFHRRLRFGRVSIQGVSLTADLSNMPEGEKSDAPGGNPIEIADLFRVNQFRLTNADIVLKLPGNRSVRLDDIRAFVHSGANKHTLKLSTGEGRVSGGENLEFPLLAVKLSGELNMAEQAFSLVHGEINAGDISVFARGKLSKLGRGSALPHANFVAQTSLPLSLADALFPDLKLNARGRAAVHARIIGPLNAPAAEGDISLRQASVADFTIGNTYVALKLEDGTVTLRKLDLEIGQGHITGQGTVSILDESLPTNVALTLKNVGFGRLAEMVTLTGAWPDFSAGGKVSVSGTLSPLHLTGKAALDVKNFKVFDRAWNARGREAMLEFAPAKVSLGLDLTTQGIRLADALVQTKNSSINADTYLNFDTDKGLDLTAKILSLDLGRDLGHLIGIPWKGTVQGSARIKGPYSELDISGQVDGRNIGFQALNFGTVGLDIHFGGKDGNILSFRDVQVQRGKSHFSAKGAIDLRGKAPLAQGNASFENADLSDFVVMLEKTHWLFEMLKGKSSARLTGTASVKGELLKPESLVEIQFKDLVYYGRQFGDADFTFSTRDGEVISVDRFESEGPIGSVSAQGQVLLSEGLDFQISGPSLSLHDLSLPQGEGKDIKGTMNLTARLFGPFDKVILRGEAALTGTEIMGVRLGDGFLDLGMDDDVLWLRGPLSPAMTAEARMSTSGEMPFGADFKISTRKIEDHLPEGVKGIRGRFRADVHAEGTVDDIENMAGTVLADQLAVSKDDMRLWAQDEFEVSFDGKGALTIPKLTLRGTDDMQLTLTDLTKSDTGAVWGNISGWFSARLIQMFTDTVKEVGGEITTDLKLWGTLGEPSLSGTLQLKEVHGEMAEFPVSAQDMTGTLTLAPGRLFIDGLKANMNDGTLAVDGHVDLSEGFSPESMDLKIAIDSAAMAIPAYMPSTLSGDVHLVGTFDNMFISGSAAVSNARYRRDIGIDPKSILSKLSEKMPKFMNVNGEAEKPWLKFDLSLHLGEEIWITNNLVNTRIGGDLEIVGDNLNIGLLGTARTEDRGKVFFRGSEFELKRASVDFTERDRIAAILDILGETELRDYRIFLRVLGSLDEPEVTLSSEPALDQADILMLLTLGFTTRETEMASTSVGIGLIGETLLNLSGIDQQVKRFIPKNAIIKDFSVQLSTQYSDVSGTVEPMAQLETKIISDDLRLRFSQPVMSNKGRQVRLEYKLNEMVSTQMQWTDESSGSSTMGDLGVDLKLRWEFE